MTRTTVSCRRHNRNPQRPVRRTFGTVAWPSNAVKADIAEAVRDAIIETRMEHA